MLYVKLGYDVPSLYGPQMIKWKILNIKLFLERFHIFEDVEGIMKTTKAYNLWWHFNES
jgi:hypothetical protein